MPIMVLSQVWPLTNSSMGSCAAIPASGRSEARIAGTHSRCACAALVRFEVLHYTQGNEWMSLEPWQPSKRNALAYGSEFS